MQKESNIVTLFRCSYFRRMPEIKFDNNIGKNKIIVFILRDLQLTLFCNRDAKVQKLTVDSFLHTI